FAELLAAANVFLLTLGKITQEFLLMAMDEFRIIRLPDGFVQGSSIMPQKRNPVALEHVRAIASRALGESLGVFTAVHNTPFGDINDVEDDLQPLILISLKNAVRSANLLGASLRNAKFDIAKMEAKAGENFITATELADTLVRREGISFRQAHRIVAKAIAAALEGGEELRADSIRRIFKAETGNELSMSQEEITETFSPKHFVEVRNILGGPSPDEVRRALAVERTREKEDLEWLKIVEDFLSNAQNELNDAIDKILSV
ncbi:MAG TPA: lyase family protein, partial [Pyrinomonadaceae bacterium]|nr:lyase family protein [Pyrinomonadaceae bacterium]